MANTSLPRIPILKLIIWSLVIGLILSMFNLGPQDVYDWVGETGQAIFEWIYEFGQSIGPYVLMGAMIVLPVWGVAYLWKMFKNRKN